MTLVILSQRSQKQDVVPFGQEYYRKTVFKQITSKYEPPITKAFSSACLWHTSQPLRVFMSTPEDRRGE